MLNIFKRDESLEIELCRNLGERASIEALLEGDSFYGFIIEIHGYLFDDFCSSPNAKVAFVQIIDRRIKEHDFSNLYIHPASTEIDSDQAPRVVFNTRGRVLTSWNG